MRHVFRPRGHRPEEKAAELRSLKEQKLVEDDRGGRKPWPQLVLLLTLQFLTLATILDSQLLQPTATICPAGSNTYTYLP